MGYEMKKHLGETSSQLFSMVDNLAAQFQEIRLGVLRASDVSGIDPEMALGRVRKVLEYMIREVYERRSGQPAGTRPLENIIQQLQRESWVPERVVAYASAVRILGNAGVHSFEGGVTATDVYQSLSLLTPVLEWYCTNERPDALVQGAHAKEPVELKVYSTSKIG
jgi:hypothetical protein